MDSKLLFKVGQGEKGVAGVEAFLVLPVAALHLAVVPWGVWPDELVADAISSFLHFSVPDEGPLTDGAGKSTLVNLACRFFEPTEGQILIDGRDYRERSQLWLHFNIGYVLQDPHLFSGTMRDNIRYGRLDATDREIEAAARILGA